MDSSEDFLAPKCAGEHNQVIKTDSLSSIRLSTLNPEIRHKLVKFDTKNDGTLTLEESLQALVTLQKQSNNYKKILYLLIPVLILTLACSFGVNILAINLTKDLQSSSSSSSSTTIPVLANKKGEILSTVSFTDFQNLLDLAMSVDFEPSSIQQIQFGDLSLQVTGIYLETLDNQNVLNPVTNQMMNNHSLVSLFVSTPMVWFSFSTDSTYNIGYLPGLSNTNPFASRVHTIIENELKLIQQALVYMISTETIITPSSVSHLVVDNNIPAHLFDAKNVMINNGMEMINIQHHKMLFDLFAFLTGKTQTTTAQKPPAAASTPFGCGLVPTKCK